MGVSIPVYLLFWWFIFGVLAFISLALSFQNFLFNFKTKGVPHSVKAAPADTGGHKHVCSLLIYFHLNRIPNSL